jgi:hypothetical protein
MVEIESERFVKMFGCNTARILKFPGRLYLLIGYRRSTVDDSGQWYHNGEPFDFTYVAENCIASGTTEEELLASAEEYKRLCEITMEDYLKEIAGLS